jgi:Ca2+-binding EF-hand superfamily protein
MSDVDKDGDGKVSFEEWMEDLYPDVTSKSEFKELRDEFDRFDVDGDGYITLKELQDSLLKGENWAEEKLEVEDKPDDWWSDEDN